MNSKDTGEGKKPTLVVEMFGCHGVILIDVSIERSVHVANGTTPIDRAWMDGFGRSAALGRA